MSNILVMSPVIAVKAVILLNNIGDCRQRYSPSSMYGSPISWLRFITGSELSFIWPFFSLAFISLLGRCCFRISSIVMSVMGRLRHFNSVQGVPLRVGVLRATVLISSGTAYGSLRVPNAC